MRGTGRGIAVVVALGVLALAAPAAANTYEVTRRGDPAPDRCRQHNCSLREAIRAANAHAGADEVVLPSSRTYNLSIANSSGAEDGALEGDLDITNNPLLIRHPGSGKAKIDANGIDRVFDAFAGARTRFVKLVIRGGRQPTGDGFGGGIHSDASLTLERTSVRGNRATQDGGGIGFPEGDASLTMRRSSVSGNFSGNDGGGLSFNDTGGGHLTVDRSELIGNEADDWGGGLITAVGTTITRTTISGNKANDGSGGGAVIEDPVDRSVIKDSTLSGNRAIDDGGGLVVDFTPGATRVVNTTIAGNHTESSGGGLWVIDSGAVSLNAVTVARNSADDSGGGLFSENTNPFKVENSLIALNSATTTGDDCADGGDAGEEFDSLGHNLRSTGADCDGFGGPADIIRGNPRIGDLGPNGGPTKTIPLRRGSPAIGHAKRSSAPNEDQRGKARDGHPDAGAYERQ